MTSSGRPVYQGDTYGRAAFHGIPGGQEINSFVAAVINLSGAGKAVNFLLKRKIDARLYEDLVTRYHIERVPFLIINDQDTYMGNKTLEDIVNLLIN